MRPSTRWCRSDGARPRAGRGLLGEGLPETPSPGRGNALPHHLPMHCMPEVVADPRTVGRLDAPEQGVAGGQHVAVLFDGLQVVATGALRGAADTRTPMLANLAGHWVLGLPLGYALCFWFGVGVIGLWVGLAQRLAFALWFGWWLFAARALTCASTSAPGSSTTAGR